MALGANIINMSVVAAIGCYYIYALLKKISPEWIAISIAAWMSVVLASLMCAFEIGFSGTIALPVVTLAMIKVHMVIGIAEALITIVLVNIFRSMSEGDVQKR